MRKATSIRTFPKHKFLDIIILKFKMCHTTTNLPGHWRKSYISSRRISCLIRAAEKKPSLYCQRFARWPDERRKNISMQSTRKTLNKNCLHFRTPRQMPLSTKMNIKGQHEYAKMNLDRPVKFWKSMTKLDFFIFDPWISSIASAKKGTAYEQKNTSISMVKQGGGAGLFWGCFCCCRKPVWRTSWIPWSIR